MRDGWGLHTYVGEVLGIRDGSRDCHDPDVGDGEGFELRRARRVGGRVEMSVRSFVNLQGLQCKLEGT